MPKSARRLKSVTHHQRSLFRLNGRKLDFLLLAGCSCLLTVIYHPVAETLQANSATTQSAIAATTNSTPQSVSALYLTLPPKREEVQEEEVA